MAMVNPFFSHLFHKYLRHGAKEHEIFQEITIDYLDPICGWQFLENLLIMVATNLKCSQETIFHQIKSSLPYLMRAAGRVTPAK